MAKLIEADLVKIRWALAKPSLVEALRAMETTLSELGYKRTWGMVQEDTNLPRGVACPVSSSPMQIKV